MPKRDRLADSALGLVVGVGLSLLLLIWAVPEFRNSNVHIVQPHGQSTDRSSDDQGPAEGHWWPEFAARDTYAQWIAAIVSVASTVVSVWAILLVRSTLEETRKTTKAAVEGAQAAEITANEARNTTKLTRAAIDISRESMLAADRAWIKVDVSLKNFLQFDEEMFRVWGNFRFSNVGNAPATHVSLVAELHESITAAAFAAERLLKSSSGASLALMGWGRVIFPDDTVEEEWELECPIAKVRDLLAEFEKEKFERKDGAPITINPSILAGARYLLPGDSKVRCTFIPLEIRRKDAPFEGWDGSSSSTFAEELKLVPGFLTGQVR